MASPTTAAQADRLRTDRRLLEQYARSRSPRDHEALVERFMPLVLRIVRRYARPTDPVEDLVQVASIGLLKAIDRFDVEREVSFSTFAVPTISGELKRYFRDSTWAVRPPRDLLERALRIERTADAYTGEHGHSPTVAQLVDLLEDLDEEDVLEGLEARRAQRSKSMQAPAGDDPDAPTVGDSVGRIDDGYAQAENRAVLDQLLPHVSERDRYVLHLRFERQLTQGEIGERLGVSQMQVSRIVRQALARLNDVAERERGRRRSARPDARAVTP